MEPQPPSSHAAAPFVPAVLAPPCEPTPHVLAFEEDPADQARPDKAIPPVFSRPVDFTGGPLVGTVFNPVFPPAEIGRRYVTGPALQYTIEAVCGRARASTIFLPHGPVRTPVFMPVGTQGTVKGLTTADLQVAPLDCDIILGNTYHLGNRPGGDTLEKLGGLHSFMSWPRNILTDSGGFQMVSLLALAEITEEGVTFAHPSGDGSRMLLTPEMSIQLQNQIGSDIMMALDDVVDSRTLDLARFTEACYRTLRWIDRCIGAHGKPGSQNLYGIVQGGLDTRPGGLRDVCLRGMLARDASLPAYAIGGLAGGESKVDFWRVVDHCCKRLPPTKPRYLMGVGYPLDIVVTTALGVDQYDCVYPTRTARFGSAMVHAGLLRLKAASMASDDGPIDPTCSCYVCATYSRGYLHALLKSEALGPQLISHHNIAYMMRLTREMRAAIKEGTYGAYVRAFVFNMFPKGLAPAGGSGCSSSGAGSGAGAVPAVPPALVPGKRKGGDDAEGASFHIPGWVVDALQAAGIDLTLPEAALPHAEAAALARYKASFAATPRATSVPSAEEMGGSGGGAGQ